MNDMKTCRKCEVAKPLSEFYLRSESAKPRSVCKVCHHGLTSKYYRANSSKIYELNKEWAKNNRTKVQAKSKRHYDKNKENILAKNREWHKNNRDKVNVRHSLFWKSNPGLLTMTNRRRKLAVKSATPSWANKKKMLDVYREAKAQGKHVDHIVPITSHLVCGLHNEFNLQLLTQSENSSKKNRIWPDMP